MASANAPTPGERLQRLLVVVPYIVRNPGVTVDTLADRFAVPREELVEDISLLFITGAPPYSPGDLIDVDIDDEDRVTITMADYFARPMAMTRPEALELFLRARAAAATLPDDAVLRGAVEKLEEVLGATAQTARLETMPQASPDVLDVLDVLSGAARDHRVCRITYHAASSGKESQREIEPEEVFLGIGAWYVDAWDRLRDAERLFRLDRISAIEVLDATFEPRNLQGSDRPLYRPGEDDVAVRLRLSPPARWVSEYYAVEDRVESGEELLVTVRSSHREWLLRLLLRLGADATIVDSPAVADEVRALAGSILSRYRETDPA